MQPINPWSVAASRCHFSCETSVAAGMDAAPALRRLWWNARGADQDLAAFHEARAARGLPPVVVCSHTSVERKRIAGQPFLVPNVKYPPNAVLPEPQLDAGEGISC